MSSVKIDPVIPPDSAFPRYRPVADHALLVELGEAIDPALYERIWQLDAALAAHPIEGVTETVPAYASLLIDFDPVVTDHQRIKQAVERLLRESGDKRAAGTLREMLVCYESPFAPDLDAVASATGLDPEAVIATHLAGSYRVVMYGFVPGFAYLAGTPEVLRLPRKPTPQRGIPAGSVLIAGPQCLVTTLTMPTGWWIIGRSPTAILAEDSDQPFLFDVGDSVRFKRINRRDFDIAARRG